MLTKAKRARAGQPPKSEEISLNRIVELMLKASIDGDFFCMLPGTIYSNDGVMVSLNYLSCIKDPEFLKAKSVAHSYCVAYWTDMIKKQQIPSAVWAMVMKNVGDFRDNRNITVEAIAHKPDEPREVNEALEQVKMIISEQAIREPIVAG